MKKLLILATALMLLAGCSSKPTTKVGKYESEPNDKGDVTVAEVKLEGDKITSVFIDVNTANGSKKELKEEYGMKKASAIGKEWYEQAAALEQFIVENGVDAVTVGEDQKATNEDLLAGCTMAVKDYVDAVKAAIENAK